MGSKIPLALTSADKKITVLEYEKNQVGKLTCCTDGCKAELSFVQRHNREYDSNTIEIQPCFRLKKYEKHSKNCKYDLVGQMDIIAKTSDSAVLSAINESKYEFRLHILLQALWETKKGKVDSQTSTAGASNSKNKSYSTSGKLSNYLKTLKQILELRSICEDNDDLRKLVVLNYRGNKVNWDEFYFDHKNIADFVRIYGKEKYLRPLAIAGHINKITEPSDKFSYHTVHLRTPYVKPNEDGVIVRANPQIVLKKDSLLELIDPNKEYIFFGRWDINPKESTDKDGQKWLYNNIKMYIENKDHFLEC